MKDIIDSAITVIDDAFNAGAEVMAPLYSGGHDSFCAVYIASKHPKFDGRVYNFVTGIGAKATIDFIQATATEQRWDLVSFTNPGAYEKFVRMFGFPGPAGHRWAYVFLKERCLRQLMRVHKGKNVALITGARSHESIRRMGHVVPLQIGERTKTGVSEKRRYWTNPCHDWTSDVQREFMKLNDFPRNPLKDSPIGMSGECFCGAFARPNEIALIRHYAPDVAAEIDRLSIIAKDSGKHCVWGTRPDRKKGVVISETGPMCNSCDIRAANAGIIVRDSTK